MQLKYHVDSFNVSIEAKEILQDYENHKGEKLSRFIKKTDVKVGIFGKDFSSSSLEFISFIRSVLNTFSVGKLGKQIHMMELKSNDKNSASSQSKSGKEFLIAKKKEDNGEIALVFEFINEEEIILHTQTLTYCACEQLKDVMSKAFNYLSPDIFLSEEDITEKRKEKNWSSLSDDEKKHNIQSYIHLRNKGSLKKEGKHYIIPTSVIKNLLKKYTKLNNM